MFDDVVSDVRDDGSIELFGLSVGFRMVGCRRELFDGQIFANNRNESLTNRNLLPAWRAVWMSDGLIQ